MPRNHTGPDPLSTSPTLVAALRLGFDDRIWHQFVERYTPTIFRWIKRHGLQDSDAADVSQEVILKILKAIRTFQYDREKGSFRAWLKTIAINAARDWGRKRQVQVKALREMSPGEDAWDGLGQAIEDEYRQEILGQAKLIVQQRAEEKTWKIWEMLTEQAIPAAEVAKRSGVPVAQVYIAKSRILQRLQKTTQELIQLDEGKLRT